MQGQCHERAQARGELAHKARLFVRGQAPVARIVLGVELHRAHRVDLELPVLDRAVEDRLEKPKVQIDGGDGTPFREGGLEILDLPYGDVSGEAPLKRGLNPFGCREIVMKGTLGLAHEEQGRKVAAVVL